MATAITGIITTFVPILGFLAMALYVVGNMMIDKITHLFVARNPLSKQTYATIYRMKEQRRKDGSVWWVSFPFAKIKIPAPPDEVVDIIKGGRKMAEGYLVSSDEVIWIKDHGMHGAKGEEVLKAFQPFSVTQRSTLVSEYETAYAKKTKSILSPEMIMPLATVGLLGIVIMLVVIYWGELAKPITDMADMNLQMAQENVKMADLNAKTMALMQGGSVVFTQEVHASNSSALISGGSTEKPPT